MVFIQEAAEDPTFLPGLSSCERFSLRYYPAENDVSNDLYEYAAAKLLNAAKKGMAESALRELALMSDGGADARGLSDARKSSGEEHDLRGQYPRKELRPGHGNAAPGAFLSGNPEKQ